MDRIPGQVALVTGGGRGFGRAFALALAESGMRVAVAARSRDQVEETAQLIRARGGDSCAVTVDVTDGDGVRSLVEDVERQLGEIDLLINSAGSGPPFGPTWESDSSQWWKTVETNLKGPFLCCQAVVPGMVKRKRGRIINVASGAGTTSIPYMSAYVTSKAALIRFSEVLADEVREHGVSVFAIQPGTVRTAMAEELLKSPEGKRWLPWLVNIFEEGRGDMFEPGVDLMRYLASGRADALSGRMFFAPGTPEDIGRHAARIQADNLHVLRMKSI